MSDVPRKLRLVEALCKRLVLSPYESRQKYANKRAGNPLSQA